MTKTTKGILLVLLFIGCTEAALKLAEKSVNKAQACNDFLKKQDKKKGSEVERKDLSLSGWKK